ncbi:MAG: helix-turn-helix domain-containing protein [Candidatus Lokiarchaeia archaeon]|nr:helix-turn-helix domain-containing protein [Candidatus Lokiarchaeia archaeon]
MKQLKKIVLKIPLDSMAKQFFDLLEKYELLQIHRQDEDQIFATQKVKFKDPKMDPKMLEGKNYGMSYIEIIKEDRGNNEFIFFSKHKWIKQTKDFLDKLDLIIDPPIILDRDRLLVNIITESKNIDKFVESLDSFYNTKLEILSISDIQPNYENLFLKLTDRQKEVAYYAVQHGYFEIPRRINSKKIANHFKISRSALYDHLRKIEKTIYHSIFK